MTIRPPSHFPITYELHIDVVCVADGRTTACNIRQQHPGHVMTLGYGEAVRRRRDPKDPTLGVNLAFLRALESAADSVRRELLATGHEDLCGLPAKRIAELKAKWLAEQQEAYRNSKEFFANLTGGVTPAMVGLTEDEDDG